MFSSSSCPAGHSNTGHLQDRSPDEPQAVSAYGGQQELQQHQSFTQRFLSLESSKASCWTADNDQAKDKPGCQYDQRPKVLQCSRPHLEFGS